MVNAPALISGMSKPTNSPTATTTTATSDKPQPGREETPVLYASDPGATWQAMVAPLDIAGALSNIDSMLKELERDYPELRQDIWNVGGDMSGKALTIARQPAVVKVIERRVNYYSALVRSLQMGVAIGGWRGYKDYEGYNLDSYEAGKLDFELAEREVFPPDPTDELTNKNLFWATVSQAVSSGAADFETIARDYGWGDEKIAEYEARRQKAFTEVEL
jgi:hypothetical protein